MSVTAPRPPLGASQSLLGVVESESVKHEARLTKRQVEVLTLVAEGHSNRSIAEALYISKRTVDFHLTSIYDKFQVVNRVQASRAAMRLGLIPLEPYGQARAEV